MSSSIGVQRHLVGGGGLVTTHKRVYPCYVEGPCVFFSLVQALRISCLENRA